MSKLPFSTLIIFFATLCNASYDRTVAQETCSKKRKIQKKRRKEKNKSSDKDSTGRSVVIGIGLAGASLYLYKKKDSLPLPDTPNATTPISTTTTLSDHQIIPPSSQNNINSLNIEKYRKSTVLIHNISEDEIPDEKREIRYSKGKTKLEYNEEDQCYSFELKDLGPHFFLRKKNSQLTVQPIPYILAMPTKAYLQELIDLNKQNASREIEIHFTQDGGQPKILQRMHSLNQQQKISFKFNLELTFREVGMLLTYVYAKNLFPKTTYIYDIMLPKECPNRHIDKQLKDLDIKRILLKLGTDENNPPSDCQLQVIPDKQEIDTSSLRDIPNTTTPSDHQIIPLPAQNNINFPNIEKYRKSIVLIHNISEDEIPDEKREIRYRKGKIELEYDEEEQCYFFEPKDLGPHLFIRKKDNQLFPQPIPYILAMPTKVYLQELIDLNKKNASEEIEVQFIEDKGPPQILLSTLFSNSQQESLLKFNPQLTIREISMLLIYVYRRSFFLETTYIYEIIFPKGCKNMHIDKQLKDLDIKCILLKLGTDENNPPSDCRIQAIEIDDEDESEYKEGDEAKGNVDSTDKDNNEENEYKENDKAKDNVDSTNKDDNENHENESSLASYVAQKLYKGALFILNLKLSR